MLKLLRKIFRRDVASSSAVIDENVSDEEVWQALHPNAQAELEQRRIHLPEFVRFITSHLKKIDSERMSQAARDALDDESEDSYLALVEGIEGEDGQEHGKWILVLLDWKATEEITWQVNECLAALGAQDRWNHICEEEFKTVPEALQALSEWLSQRNYDLLHVETSGDCYCSFILKTTAVARAKELANAADLTLYDQNEFVAING